MSLYLRPHSMDEVLALLAQRPGLRLLAGGTDVYPALPPEGPIGGFLDLSGVEALQQITEVDGALRIGAMASWALVQRALRDPVHAALVQAAREVGSPQIQAVGTVGGNLCNASPAADGTVALMALEAEVEIAGPGGQRRMPVAEFVTGVRKVALAPGEVVVALWLPPLRGCSAFQKLGARRYLVISIAMVAARCETGPDGRIVGAAVAVGACSPVARRLPGLEAALVGAKAGDLAGLVTPERIEGLAPISDVRAPAGYRAEAVPVLVRRALAACLEG